MKYTKDDVFNKTEAQKERDDLLEMIYWAVVRKDIEHLSKVLSKVVYELYEDRIKEEKKNNRRDQINQDLEDAMDLEWGSGGGGF
ncbi:hypothetical protein 000TH008_197 [Bacillus phage 000TH008]|nr:hypothetical protein 000TH008_197 [Bacillus phage 000TH008]QQO40890.1 hypothetical protein 000TH009_197 [Bacillus phage 000TH009]